MSDGTIEIKLTINAKVADNEPIEVGQVDLPVSFTLTESLIDLESAISSAFCDCQTTECVTHNPVQHRDGKPPWCNSCKKK